MIYRRLDNNGDYSFGRGRQDFISDSSAVAQAVKTRLQFAKATFWRDIKDGTPWVQNIWGTSGSAKNRAVVDSILQNRIAGTQGCKSLISYESVFSKANRVDSIQVSLDTIFGTVVVQEQL